jgi:phage-related protein
MRKIIYYKNQSGHCFVEEFLDSLSDKQAQRVVWVLLLIEQMEVVPIKYFKKLTGTDDIWEVRVHSGNNQFRLLGFYDDDNEVVLTNGFPKTTKKIPKTELDNAQNRKNDYLNIKIKKN